MATVEEYLHNLYRVNPDFMYSVTRDFAKACQTPLLVMPDDTPSHPYEPAMAMVDLAPNAEVTAYPWKESKDIYDRTVNQVRDFFKAHVPAVRFRLRGSLSTLDPSTSSGQAQGERRRAGERRRDFKRTLRQAQGERGWDRFPLPRKQEWGVSRRSGSGRSGERR